MLIPFATEIEARAHETPARRYGNAWNADGQTTGWRAVDTDRLLHEFPQLAGDIQGGGWLLTIASEKNSTRGFRWTHFVRDAEGAEVGPILPRAAWLRRETMRALLPDVTATPRVKRRASIVARELLDGRDDLPDAGILGAMRARLVRFAELEVHIEMIALNQWGPSPNEAYPTYTHDENVLWETLDLATAQTPDKEMQRWIENPATFRAALTDASFRNAELVARLRAALRNAASGQEDLYILQFRHRNRWTKAAQLIAARWGIDAI